MTINGVTFYISSPFKLINNISSWPEYSSPNLWPLSTPKLDRPDLELACWWRVLHLINHYSHYYFSVTQENHELAISLLQQYLHLPSGYYQILGSYFWNSPLPAPAHPTFSLPQHSWVISLFPQGMHTLYISHWSASSLNMDHQSMDSLPHRCLHIQRRCPSHGKEASTIANDCGIFQHNWSPIDSDHFHSKTTPLYLEAGTSIIKNDISTIEIQSITGCLASMGWVSVWHIGGKYSNLGKEASTIEIDYGTIEIQLIQTIFTAKLSSGNHPLNIAAQLDTSEAKLISGGSMSKIRSGMGQNLPSRAHHICRWGGGSSTI